MIANGVSNFEYTITIDKGSGDGIEVDQPVATGFPGSPMLVGRVVVRSRPRRPTCGSSSIATSPWRRPSRAPRRRDSSKGQGDADLRMSLVEPGTLIEGDESVFTQGYEVDGQAGLYPPGMLIGQVSRTVPAENETQAYVEVRPAVDFETLQFVLVLQAQDGGVTPMTRRVLVTIVIVVTALLLQSTLFWQLKLLGVRPELMYLVTIVIAILEGPQEGAVTGFVGGHRPGLPAEPAQGHHGADAHAGGLRGRARAPVHRVALAAAADDPRGGRHRRRAWRSTRSWRSCSASSRSRSRTPCG